MEIVPVTTENVSPRTIAEQIVEVAKKLEASKALYEEMDKLTAEFQKVTGTGIDNTIFVGEKAVTLVDNFASNNTQFRPAAFRRFEVKVEDAEKYLKRLKKEVK